MDERDRESKRSPRQNEDCFVEIEGRLVVLLNKPLAIALPWFAHDVGLVLTLLWLVLGPWPSPSPLDFPTTLSNERLSFGVRNIQLKLIAPTIGPSQSHHDCVLLWNQFA